LTQARKSVLGEKFVRKPLVDKENILLPPLHIKLGLMEKSVKAVNTNSKDSEHLRENFPKTSDVKLKECFFIGPQSRGIINDDLLEHLLTETEKSA
jgi:hypothetical protein